VISGIFYTVVVRDVFNRCVNVSCLLRNVKQMAFNNPQLLHKLLTLLADNIAIYADYQINSGAQVRICDASFAISPDLINILLRSSRYLIRGQAVWRRQTLTNSH
jgi:hypothetical protein